MFTLVIGASASGKSEYAEQHVLSLNGARIYVATMEPFGEEAQARIRRHHAMRRDRGFETIECYRHPEKITPPRDGNLLLEDLGNLTANILFGDSPDPAAPEEYTAHRIAARVESLYRRCAHLTVVTNEVFSGGQRYEGDTDLYLSVLARVNRLLAERADLAVEVVCGLPQVLKGPAPGCAGGKPGMIFVTGPLWAGKQTYIMKTLGWNEDIFQQRGIRDVQDLVSEDCTAQELQTLADQLARKEVVIATEIGGGIVPLDPAERGKREAAGRLACLLAERAETVVRVCCGLPMALKGKQL